MSKELAIKDFSKEQIELVKNTVAKGVTDNELQLFLYTAKKTGLDPLIKQIHAVKRGNTMTIQVAIDGYRLIAERTGKYAPGKDPVWHEEEGKIISATAFVKKLVGETWHEIGATAYFKEYAQIFNGKLGVMWEKMPHLMIAKCAEALALRRAFPAELSGLYTNEEMAQAGTQDINAQATEILPPSESSQEPTHEPVQETLPEVQENSIKGFVSKLIKTTHKKDGTALKNPIYKITVKDKTCSTFSKELFEKAQKAGREKKEIVIQYDTNKVGKGIYYNITALKLEEEVPY